MSELITWLRAQLDEDERDLGDDASGMCDGGVHLTDERWRAEVAAKRALLDELESLRHCLGCEDAPGECDSERVANAGERLLAQPYTGREGWRDEWRVA